MTNPAENRSEAVQRLRKSWWVHDRSAQQIFSILEGEDQRTRAVGGLVRDTILGANSMGGDVDMATELLPDDVIARARRAGMSCYPTGLAHGTVTIRNGQVIAEVTTLRQDVVTDGRHAQVKFGTDWTIDAQRRDFTMNALYADYNGALFDPLNGLNDLFARRVQFIGDPDQRILEDRLRVFRFFRFTASHGQENYDTAGLDACERAAGNLVQLASERIGTEMVKMLALPKIVGTLARMTKIGVMDFSVESLQALVRYEAKTGSPVVAARLAVLLGKMDLERMRTEWRLSNALVKEARQIREAADMMIKGDLYNSAYRHGRFAYVAIPVACAVGEWSPAQCDEVNEFWERMTVPSFPVKGQDLIDAGYAQGPKLGQALHQVEEEWVAGGFVLEREELLARMNKYLN